MQKNRKAGATNTGSKPKTFMNASSNQNAFDVSDYATTAVQKQQLCDLCNPSAGKGCTGAELCAECAAKADTLATAIFGHLAKPRKVVRLQRCLSCSGCFAPSKFSAFYGVCKNCVSDVQEKSKVARSNFVARTVNNFHKMLKGVAAL